MLIVIPKNKLESIDSVTPLLREIYQKKQIKIEVVIFSYKNFKQIKKNVFLFDTIKSFGKIKFVERENFLKFTNKILKFLTLINFMIKGAIGYKFLHFGYLEAGPFKIIGILFKKNVFMCQTNSYSDIRVDLKFNLKNKEAKFEKPFGKSVIAFNQEYLERYKNHSIEIFNFGPPRLRESWLNYTKEKAPSYFAKYHPRLNLDEKYVVFPISSLNKEFFLLDDAYPNLFIKILKILSEEFNNIKILVKPHPVTRTHILDDCLRRLNNKNIEVTYLHPNLLAYNAKFFITELYSTVIADAHLLGLTTIEFSNYKESVLKKTNRGSIGGKYVDFFINNDEDKLRNLLKNLKSEKEFSLSNINRDTEDQLKLLQAIS